MTTLSEAATLTEEPPKTHLWRVAKEAADDVLNMLSQYNVQLNSEDINELKFMLNNLYLDGVAVGHESSRKVRDQQERGNSEFI